MTFNMSQSTTRIVCPYCGATMGSLLAIENHALRHDEQEGGWRCRNCGELSKYGDDRLCADCVEESHNHDPADE
jgi:RNase P subunit RPR2